MISRYFNPELYNELGYMEFIAINEDKFDLIPGTAFENMLFVNEDAVNYYDFSIVDTSQLTAFNMAHKFANFKTDRVQNSVLQDFSKSELF